jgi:RNA polymerase II elongation factor ELL
MDLARKYRIFYPKYEALHREVASLGARRDSEKEQRLLDMHERLSVMKKDILAGIVEAH